MMRLRTNIPRYFFDTEFQDHGDVIDLISIGVVCSDGRELYAVNGEAELHKVNPWVRSHVLPQLPPYGDPAWTSKYVIGERLREFVKADEGQSEFWAYYGAYDWVVLCQIYGAMMNLPKQFPKFCMDLKALSVLVGSPEHPAQKSGEHNALADARWNRDLYTFLLERAEGEASLQKE